MGEKNAPYEKGENKNGLKVKWGKLGEKKEGRRRGEKIKCDKKRVR